MIAVVALSQNGIAAISSSARTCFISGDICWPSSSNEKPSTYTSVVNLHHDIFLKKDNTNLDKYDFQRHNQKWPKKGLMRPEIAKGGDCEGVEALRIRTRM